MYKIYQVKNGDTLQSIASNLSVSPLVLADINGLMPSAILSPGDFIVIPNVSDNIYFDKYTVKKGDTIYEIAKNKNIAPSQLLRLNGLSDNDILYIGQEIMVPRNDVLFYITSSDDTLDDVYKKFNVSLDEVNKQNKTIYLTNDQLIVYKRQIYYLFFSIITFLGVGIYGKFRHIRLQ